jgi:hypothetical protein
MFYSIGWHSWSGRSCQSWLGKWRCSRCNNGNDADGNGGANDHNADNTDHNTDHNADHNTDHNADHNADHNGNHADDRANSHADNFCVNKYRGTSYPRSWVIGFGGAV